MLLMFRVPKELREGQMVIGYNVHYIEGKQHQVTGKCFLVLDSETKIYKPCGIRQTFLHLKACPTKMPEVLIREKMVSLTNSAGKKIDMTIGRIKVDPYLLPCTKLSSKWIKNLNMRSHTMNRYRKKYEVCFNNGARVRTLNRTAVAQGIGPAIRNEIP